MDNKVISQNLIKLDNLCLISNLQNKENFSVLQIDPFNFGLFIFSTQSSRISFIHLRLTEFSRSFKNDIGCSNNFASRRKSLEINLLNVFCLPFTSLTVLCVKRNVWAIGQEAIVNLTPYVEHSILKSKSYENNDSMDIDVVEEFQPNMLDIEIDVTNLEKYNLHFNDVFFGCHFLDYAIIQCHKNSRLCVWELEFLFADDTVMPADAVVPLFLDFPVSYNKSYLNIASNQGQNGSHNPLIVFIHHSDPEYHILKNIFGIICVSSSVVCLIGHPDGKVLWTFCDSRNQFRASHGLQNLFDLKQSIVGIFFIKDIEGFEGCDCILLVGGLGQLTLISSKQYLSFTQESGSHTFWTKTAHISSSITYCDVLKNCLLYISKDGELLVSNLSLIFQLNDSNQQLILNSSLCEFDCIDQMVIAYQNEGLIFLKTKYGSLYLTQLTKSEESETLTSSLPFLMNECLKQSNKMQELLNMKVLQNRVFAMVSTFASLKFLKNTIKEPLTFSISEVNVDPKKYILVINLNCLEQLHLDSELCYTSATVFTFFKNNNSFITKSVPYKADESTLCLELIDTVLQPPFVSIFPLFVEVGLILQLPETWKTLGCFQSLSSFLPFYIRIQTFMVHELNLLQNNALCFPQSLKFEATKTLKMVKELGVKRAVSNALQVHSKKDFNLLKKFTLCLSVSTVKEMLQNTEYDPCKYIENLLFGNILQSNMSKESYLTSKCSPISINVSNNSTHIVISLTANNPDSLIGFRIAVMEILLFTFNKSTKQSTSSSTYVNIPANIFRRCEEISKSLISLYGKDVEADEVTDSILNLYKELRTDISGKLPIL